MYSPTARLGAVDKPRELFEGEEKYSGDLIASLRLEGIRAWERFEAKGELADIDKAIDLKSQAVDHTLEGRLDRPAILNDLGITHLVRFERLGEMADIDKAIELTRQAADLTPDDHPNKPGYVSSVGTSHTRRFERLGKAADIVKAIELMRQAVDLASDDHPHKPGCLSDLGTSHLRRFEHLGEIADINKAVEYQSRAVDLTPDGHPDKLMLFTILGMSHHTRFECLGEMADMYKSIEFQCRAVDVTPDGHPHKAGRLGNLGCSYLRRFEHLGEMADINKAIEYQSRAVELTPNGHIRKPMCLSNLGESYYMRFERFGEIADMYKAIEYQRKAVDVTPDGHPEKPTYLNNLSGAHLGQFAQLGEIVDINKSIEYQRQAVDLTPYGHPKMPMFLCNLGTSQRTRLQRLGEMANSDEANIDEAIEYQRQAVDLIPDGHPEKPKYLHNLGTSHQTRFERLGEIADIDKTIKLLRQAVYLTPDGHPEKPGRLSALGGAHLVRGNYNFRIADIDEAINNFELCALSITGPPIVRFGAARCWIYGLQLKTLFSTSHAPSLLPQHTLINLIPELIWLGAPIQQRFQMIQDVVGSSVHEAVSAAIRAQELELAVEWMEQGRSIVWSQLRRLRSPLVDLQCAHPDLAQEFQDAQRRIEVSFLPHNVDNETESAADSLDRQAQAHRRNIQTREDLLTEIRGKEGFESFLRPEKFSVLSKACQGHIAVLLTVAGVHCDALVISPSSSIFHILFTNVSQDVIRDLRNQWETSCNTRLNNRGDKRDLSYCPNHCLVTPADGSLRTRFGNRGEGPAITNMDPMASMLSQLWEKIVHPLVNQIETLLYDSTDDRMARIIWCPSGPLSFLPLHAAGIYGPRNSEDRICLSDIAVSSYTPSLMALQSTPRQLGVPSILMVTQPDTPNQSHLPGTLREAEKIMKQAASNHLQSFVCHLSQGQATVSAVIEKLQHHGWIHLACHGTQKSLDPMESSFALHDGSLTLATLVQKSMAHAQFAFLSACQTATGATSLPDEAMHLASGMLAAGFSSVVGTIWSIEDSVAPEVAEEFYAALFEEGQNSDWKAKLEPAYALHSALQKLREESTGDRDLMRWVPFVHYGL
ncbi:CHAT domain-containing protein [Flagelloscypha sp. PMI_526]|nr:CHAT domain-containing protein [Flagelloscypha sp. PMI_526]